MADLTPELRQLLREAPQLVEDTDGAIHTASCQCPRCTGGLLYTVRLGSAPLIFVGNSCGQFDMALRDLWVSRKDSPAELWVSPRRYEETKQAIDEFLRQNFTIPCPPDPVALSYVNKFAYGGAEISRLRSCEMLSDEWLLLVSEGMSAPVGAQPKREVNDAAE